MRRKGKRAAERRARRRARRDTRSGAEAALAALSWDGRGLEGKTTEEIVAALAALGIEAREESFRELAGAHGKVEAIAEAWEEGKELPRKWEDIPYFAARALWPRWAPDIFAPEVFLHEHFPDFLLFDELPTTPEGGRTHWRAAGVVMDLVAPSDGLPRPDLLEKLEFHSGYELGWWMSELPFALADHRVGMVEEALALCRRMATVCEAGDYLGTLSVILFEAGRRDDAFRQVEENLARFPTEVWVRIKAGDVHRKAGDPAKAEALYREAYDLTDAAQGGDDRYGAVEHLLELYREAGRQEEYVELAVAEAGLIERWEPREEDDGDEGGEEDWPEDEPWEDEDSSPAESEAAFAPTISPEAQTVQRSTPKVGRNDPCPCGSGKKYKRCCGA